MATTIHWALCKKYGLPHTEKWYDHRAEPVMENEHAKLLWDFNVQTDKTIEARRPDLILIDKIIEECKIVDVAIPGDTRVVKKEEEKNWEVQRFSNRNRQNMEEESKHCPHSHRSAWDYIKEPSNVLGRTGVQLIFRDNTEDSTVGNGSYPQKNFVLIGLCVLWFLDEVWTQRINSQQTHDAVKETQ